MQTSSSSTRFACIGLILLIVFPSGVVSAATIRVAGRCNLADAITAANRDAARGGCPKGAGRDVITLTGDETLTAINNSDNGLPAITSKIEIDGAGFSIRRAAGAPRFRIFDVRPGGELTLVDLEVTNGDTSARGGGIRSLGDLTLLNTTVSGNHSDNRGGGIYSRGDGYRRPVDVTLVDSRVVENTARRGAGIAAYDYSYLRISGSSISGNTATSRGGGLLLVFSPAALSNSTVSSNTASSGAGIRATEYSSLDISASTISDNTSTKFEGGGIFSTDAHLRVYQSLVTGNAALRGAGIFSRNEYSEMIVRSSTISNNHAVESGGGILIIGSEGSLSLTNSTISGNSAETGAGLFDGSVYYRFESEVVHSTFSGNRATEGAAIYAVEGYSYRDLVSSVVAGNDGDNCGGKAFADGGANFDDDGTCPGAAPIVAGIDFDAELGDNGGPTPTHALLEGSVAIDAGGDCRLATDQRQLPRDSLCDSGSFEFGARPLAASVSGVAVRKVYCKNLTTRSKGKASTDRSSWQCADLGVNARPPERVLLWSIGIADGVAPVGGTVEGLDETVESRIICKNRTSGEKVVFDSETPSWDCEAEGLVVTPGDSIQQKIKGQA